MNKRLNLNGYSNYFDDNSLSNKLKKAARKIGKKAVYHVLVFYYVVRDPLVPKSLKLKVLGALGYFILPIDLIPDVIVGLGYGDDILAIAWAVWSMRKYITPEMKAKARSRADMLFGDATNFDFGGTATATQGYPVSHVNPNDPRIIDVEEVE